MFNLAFLWNNDRRMDPLHQELSSRGRFCIYGTFFFLDEEFGSLVPINRSCTRNYGVTYLEMDLHSDWTGYCLKSYVPVKDASFYLKA